MSQNQIYLELGADFVLNNNGGLQWANDPWVIIRQNMERYIFTCAARLSDKGVPLPADWIFNPTFGLSANAMLGMNFTSDFISQLQQKVYQAALTISQGLVNVPPSVTVTQGNNPQQLNVQIVFSPIGAQQQIIGVTLP